VQGFFEKNRIACFAGYFRYRAYPALPHCDSIPAKLNAPSRTAVAGAHVGLERRRLAVGFACAQLGDVAAAYDSRELFDAGQCLKSRE
jgi:hypothetical protein